MELNTLSITLMRPTKSKEITIQTANIRVREIYESRQHSHRNKIKKQG